MKKLIFFLVLGILITQIGYSQSDSLQQQINNQVWKPFMRSFNSLDTKGFMAVHSKEMTRVLQED